MTQNPVNLFLGFAMQVWEKSEKRKIDIILQGQLKQADTICQAFSLEKLHLLELAGDLRWLSNSIILKQIFE